MSCPICPKRNYDVWVRGYGLVDSTKTQSAPGKIVNLTAVLAPNPRAAAEYYPALYWFALHAGAAIERLPGHRPEWQRHRDDDEDPGRMDPQHR